MLEQVSAEEVLHYEKFVVESVLGFCAVSLLDSFLPHTHEFPFFELLEK